uniref:Uncharacterized protein n=1 Tax=Cacopsylla melanoneura TaxID=428564 RepID=A0A8D9B4V6_9HEMI
MDYGGCKPVWYALWYGLIMEAGESKYRYIIFCKVPTGVWTIQSSSRSIYTQDKFQRGLNVYQTCILHTFVLHVINQSNDTSTEHANGSFPTQKCISRYTNILIIIIYSYNINI